jgi:VanZ family protein
MVKYLSHYKYAIAWALIILLLCGMNGAHFPKFDIDSFIRIDKLAHIVLFGFLSYLIAMASQKVFTNNSSFKLIYPAFLIGTAYGILIEVLQSTIFINRTYDYLDMLANTLGCIFAWVILHFKLKKQIRNN